MDDDFIQMGALRTRLGRQHGLAERSLIMGTFAGRRRAQRSMKDVVMAIDDFGTTVSLRCH